MKIGREQIKMSLKSIILSAFISFISLSLLVPGSKGKDLAVSNKFDKFIELIGESRFKYNSSTNYITNVAKNSIAKLARSEIDQLKYQSDVDVRIGEPQELDGKSIIITISYDYLRRRSQNFVPGDAIVIVVSRIESEYTDLRYATLINKTLK